MTEREPYRTTIRVRHYELDTLGHLNHAVYHSYAEVARLELFEYAGGQGAGLRKLGLAPVLLASEISFRREVRGGETVEVTCDAKFGSGKSFQMDSNIYKSDGTLAAEITCTLGMMNLDRRKLVEDPRGQLVRAGLDPRAISSIE